MKLLKKLQIQFLSFTQQFKALNKRAKYSFYFVFFLLGLPGLFIPQLIKSYLGNSKESKGLAKALVGTLDMSLIKAVSVSPVEIGNLRKTFTIFSGLKGIHEVLLYPDSKVSIKNVYVAPGDLVKKGKILAEFENEALNIRKKLSTIEFKLKEAEFVMTKNLAEKEFVSKNELSQKSLEFEAEKLRQELNRYESTNFLKSPISGIVSEVKFNTDDFIDDVSKYYIKIVDQSSFKIEAYLPYEISKQLVKGGLVEIKNIKNSENERNVVKRRTPASINKDSAAVVFLGKITRISPGLDQSTGTVSVDVEARLPPDQFQVGAFVESKFILSEAKNSIIIKNETILYDNDRPYVFKIVNGTNVELSYVNLGITEGAKTVVESGLIGVDYIVQEGQNNLKDKDKIEIFNQK